MAQDFSNRLFIKRMIIVFLSIVTIIFGSFAILFTVNEISVLKYWISFFAIQHIMWLLMVIRYNKMPYEPVVIMYISYIIIALFPIICICSNSGYQVAFFWYILIPIGVIAFDINDLTMWTIITLLASLLAFLFTPLFQSEVFSPELLSKINFMTITSVLILTIFFAIMSVRKNKFEKNAQVEALKEVIENKENHEKYKILYDQIVNYLDIEQPYKNPDFDENMLAKDLNSNTLYISMAINSIGKTNFKALLKKCRIDYVKFMIDNEMLKRYTIDYVFTEAGYKSRSTFNNAFKSIMGMTPSEYVAKNNTAEQI